MIRTSKKFRTPRAANRNDHSLPLLHDKIEEDYSDSDYTSLQSKCWDVNLNNTAIKDRLSQQNNSDGKKALVIFKSTGSRHPLVTRQKYPTSNSALNITTKIPLSAGSESDNSTSSQTYESQSAVKVIYSSEQWKDKNDSMKPKLLGRKQENKCGILIKENIPAIQGAKGGSNDLPLKKHHVSSKLPPSKKSDPLLFTSISFKSSNVLDQLDSKEQSNVNGNEKNNYSSFGFDENDNVSYHERIGAVVASKLKEIKSPEKKKKELKKISNGSPSPSMSRKSGTSHSHEFLSNNSHSHSNGEIEKAVESVTSKIPHFIESKRDTKKRLKQGPKERSPLPKSGQLNNIFDANSKVTIDEKCILLNKEASKENGVKRHDAISGSDEKNYSSPQKIVKHISSPHKDKEIRGTGAQGSSLVVRPEKHVDENEIKSDYLDISDNSFTSICLLNLSDTKAKASARLNLGLVLSGQRSKIYDKSKGSMILEEICRSIELKDHSVLTKLWNAEFAIQDEEEVQIKGTPTSTQFQQIKNQRSKLQTLLKNGRYDEASEFLIENIHSHKHQSHISSWINVGSIQLWQGKYSEAVISFENAKEDLEQNTSREARRLALLGMANYGDERFEDANQAFLRSLTMLRTKKQGYGCYNQRHDFIMGQIFNAVGCSFFETGFHKSASRSFLNALHVYLQDIFDEPLTAEESLSLEFLLNKVKLQNNDWIASVPPQFIYDTTVTFANLAHVLINQKSLDFAVSCLRLALKLQMSANEDMVDRRTMIAVLELLGQTYLNKEKTYDAEKVFEVILRTGREKFETPIKIYHETMSRTAFAMQKLKFMEGDVESSIKYTDMAQYHRKAAVDSVIKVESICKHVFTVRSKQDKAMKEEEENKRDFDCTNSNSDSLNLQSSTSYGSDQSMSSSCVEHVLSLE